MCADFRCNPRIAGESIRDNLVVAIDLEEDRPEVWFRVAGPIGFIATVDVRDLNPHVHGISRHHEKIQATAGTTAVGSG